MNKIDMKKFPYKSIRKYQQQILQIIDDTWKDYKYVFISAGTGIGKSGIAKTIASSVNKSFIITSTKQLQDQYKQEFKDVASIKGRMNYQCALNKGLNCEDGICAVNYLQRSECKELNICPYYRARDKAIKSQIFLTSYQFFLRAIECAGYVTPRNVLIFDECHLLEQQVVTWAQIDLSLSELDKEFHILEDCKIREVVYLQKYKPCKSGYDNNIKWIDFLYDLITIKRYERFEEVKSILGPYANDPDNLSDQELQLLYSKHNQYYKLDKLYKKLSVYFSFKDCCNWLVEPLKDGLQIIPLNISTLFHYYIKKMGFEKIIFMSATILNTTGFRKLLGLPKNETLSIKVESPFPAKKSPIIYKPICKMNYENLENNLQLITNNVQKIIDKHPNQKGIIHSGNKTVSNYLNNHLKSKRLLTRINDITNIDIIEKHNKSKKPTILISSSLYEGVDLKDDLSRFQIIVKMPFLSLLDKRIKTKYYIDRDWYIEDVFKKIIQASGRSTRNENDYAITYVLDKSFKWWINHIKNRGWLPKQFLKRIIWNEDEFNINEYKKDNVN